MMEEEGIVVETLGTAAKVRIDKKSACEGCSASFICHPKEHDYVDAVNLIGAVAGQKVKILVRPEVYVKASILLYGLPVLVFLTVAVAGKILALQLLGESYSDLAAFCAACLFTAITFMMIIRYHRKNRREHAYNPEIVEIL